MILGFIMNKKLRSNYYGLIAVPMTVVTIFMTAFEGLADEYCRQVSENVSLDECDQDFNEVDEDRQHDEKWR